MRRAVQDVRAPLTPSVRFRSKLELVIGPYSEACTRLVDDPRLPELWPEYLVVQHQIIRATVPLTRVALDRASELDEPELARYLELHVDEELGHDDTLLEDLALLGRPRKAVLEQMPSPAVASLVGAQYYWILHHHPVAFLGYVGRGLADAAASTKRRNARSVRRSSWSAARIS